jgi:hypothetical protein
MNVGAKNQFGGVDLRHDGSSRFRARKQRFGISSRDFGNWPIYGDSVWADNPECQFQSVFKRCQTPTLRQ